MNKPLLIPFDALRSYGITLSRDTLRRLSRVGKFPMPRRLGGHRIAFVETEVLEWIQYLPSTDARPLVRKPKQQPRRASALKEGR